MSVHEEGLARVGDIWALLYYHMARELTGTFGCAGERALRESIRRFGRERGLAMRARHISEGRPINLQSLFEHYDLPSDSRSQRTTYRLSEEERISKTTACPYADLWGEYDDGGHCRLRRRSVGFSGHGGYALAQVACEMDRNVMYREEVCHDIE